MNFEVVSKLAMRLSELLRTLPVLVLMLVTVTLQEVLSTVGMTVLLVPWAKY